MIYFSVAYVYGGAYNKISKKWQEVFPCAAKAIHAAFHPDKLNYGAYGDTGCHLHVHLVPKYRDGFEWGGVFAMNPGQTKLTDAQYAEMIGKIKAAL